MKIKMVDVARHLGISKATVSLAVNNKPGVNEQTRKKIFQCIEEMKKNNGKVLMEHEPVYKKDRNKLIKVVIFNHKKQVVCDPELDLWSEVLTTFDSGARRLGYLYGLTYINEDDEEIAAVLEECNMDLVAGVIIFGTEMINDDFDILAQIHKPMVIYDYEMPNGSLSSVCFDNVGAVEMAMNILTSEGAKDILYFCTGKDIYNFRKRKEAFQNTYIRNDMMPKKSDIVELGKTIPKITENAIQWLRSHSLPDAFLFENYQVSIGVMAALSKLKISVPEQIKIVGIDEIPEYTKSGMELIQMKVPHSERATMALELLDKEITKKWNTKIKLFAEAKVIR